MTKSALCVLGRGLVDPTEPVLRADDPGVLRGDGVFETARVDHGVAVLLAQHLARMRRGATHLGIALPAEADLRQLAGTAIGASGAGAGVLRLVCTRGPDDRGPVAYALVTPIPAATEAARAAGVDVLTLSLGVVGRAKQAAPWLLGGVKTTSYAVAMAAQREAEARGAHDVIWLSHDGEVLEGATSNVVWVRDGDLCTPPTETGILAGVTLAALAEQTPISVRTTSVEDLREADELMLTSSIRGVAPVLSLDGKPVGAGGVGPEATRLRDLYEALVRAPV